VPPWLLLLIGNSRILAIITIVAYFLYLTAKQAMSHPVALAMLLGWTEKRRDYLLALVKASRNDVDEPPGDPPPDALQIAAETSECPCRCGRTPGSAGTS
jgi:hypothetical protein